MRGVAKFRANRRAVLGAAALTAAIDGDPGFRAAVAEHVRSCEIDLAGDGELVERAAAAFLWQHPDADGLLSELAERDEAMELRQQVQRLEAELAQRRSAPAPTDQPESELPMPDRLARSGGQSELPAQLDKLRLRLREQGVALRAAKAVAAETAEQSSGGLKSLQIVHERAVTELRLLRDRLAREQARADRAQEQLDFLRASDRVARDAAHRRLELLLETVEQAATSLRREWKLTSGGPDPAQRVADELGAPQAAIAGDTASLSGWLSMPHAHLVVDGYNVTKWGYPELTLAGQRDRLIRELAGIAARTGAEVTVVFDGAPVQVPQVRHRGVRVLFSPPGVIADDVIRRLVDAEPTGRVVLVVTADREIIEAVSRAGARTVPPATLLATVHLEDRSRR